MESGGLRFVVVTRKGMVLAGAVALVLTGCGSGSSSKQASAPSATAPSATLAPSPQDPSGLYGKNFRATSATENGNARRLLSSYPIFISFGKHGRGVFFSASCNGEGAKNGHLTPEKVVVAPHGVITTLVACEPKSSEQGRWFDAFLEGNPHRQLKGRSLTLTDGTATVRFARFTPPPQGRVRQ
jgi:heat shock protein HslJ